MRRREPPAPPPVDRHLRERLDDLAVLQGQAVAARNAERPLRDLRDAEFRVFSQFGDDGIVDYLVARLDLPRSHERFVELGVEDYREANTRFLLVSRNWRGLIVDASDLHARSVAKGQLLWRHDLRPVTAFVDRDNIDGLLREHGFADELGLLSVDLDGNDYWIWEAIGAEPAIVVVEYNSVFGAERAVTIPYDAAFDRTRAHHSNLYWGASLPALARLAGRKGYRFVGSNSAGNNAYFVREELAAGLPSPSAAEGWVESRYRESRDEAGNLTYLSGPERARAIAHLPLVDVESGEKLTVGDLT